MRAGASSAFRVLALAEGVHAHLDPAAVEAVDQLVGDHDVARPRDALAEGGGGHGLERDDADEREAERERDALGGGDAHAHAREGARTRADGNEKKRNPGL